MSEARTVSTIHVDKRRIDNVINGITTVADRTFIEDAMELRDIGEKTLAFLRSIFPKSPPGYPLRGRQPLANRYRLYMFPPKQFQQGRVGFTLRPAPASDSARYAQVVDALDQGSRAYDRTIPAGQKSSLFVTSPQDKELYIRGVVGQYVFFTGDGMMLHYKARQGRHFLNKTYEFALQLCNEARAKYKQRAIDKLNNG